MPQQIAPKLRHLLLLIASTVGGLMAVGLLALLILALAPPVRASWWHLRHGHTVSVEGHRFAVPSGWYPVPDDPPGQLNLQKAHFGLSNVGLIGVDRALPNAAPGSAQRQVAAFAAHLDQAPGTVGHWVTTTIRGQQLTFVCAMPDAPQPSDSFFCAADSSDIHVSFTGDPSDRDLALNLVRSSK